MSTGWTSPLRAVHRVPEGHGHGQAGRVELLPGRAGDRRSSGGSCRRPCCWSGSPPLISMVVGIWMGIRSGWRRGSVFDRLSMFFSLVLYSMPEFWLGMLLLLLFSTAARMVPGRWPRLDERRELMGTLEIHHRRRRASLPARPDPGAGIPGRVLPPDAIVAARCPRRGLHHDRQGEGLLERNVLNRHAVRNALAPDRHA